MERIGLVGTWEKVLNEVIGDMYHSVIDHFEESKSQGIIDFHFGRLDALSDLVEPDAAIKFVTEDNKGKLRILYDEDKLEGDTLQWPKWVGDYVENYHKERLEEENTND